MNSTPAAEVARYTLPAQLLHWLIALLIFGLFPLGLYMHGLPLSVQKIELYSWHKWFGITVLLLVVLRIGWRLTHRPPPLPGDIPPWQQAAAALINVTAQIDFMPGDLAKSHVDVAVQSASVDAGSAQTNALLAGADWLAAKADPQSRFVSTRFTPDGPGCYWLNGTFSVKGHSQPLRVRVSTHPDGKDLIMDAAFKLDRTAFGLGAGSWADTSVVAAAIPVQVHLVVAPQ